MTIRLELRADCLAGTWANVAERRPASSDVTLERGDIAEGLRAAEAVGDDRIQESAGQRQAWFTLGLETGDVSLCNDTFDMAIPATMILPA